MAAVTIVLPEELGWQVLRDLDTMGNDIPLSLKRLYGYIEPQVQALDRARLEGR